VKQKKSQAVASARIGDAEHEEQDRDAKQNDVDHRPSLLPLLLVFMGGSVDRPAINMRPKHIKVRDAENGANINIL
jgi:hypothetical protein